MRVIAGSAKRLRLKTVEGMDTRPTTDRIKETLFNMLYTEVADSRFLDLFAGSGAIGIEALSRGAEHAVFVENNRQACLCIEENLNTVKLKDKGRLLQMDVLAALRKLEGEPPFDFIFMDPPYEKGVEFQILAYLKDSALADKNSLIIVEAALETSFEQAADIGFEVLKEKEYRTNKHVFLEKK